jgi:hypothetical protein
MRSEKAAWQKPGLTVLAKSRPEEAVLATCKTAYVPDATGPNKKACATAPDPGCKNLTIS